MIIQHNVMAMNTARQLGINTKVTAQKIENLSSGYRINRAADDAAGLAISEKMRSQIRGLQKASQNVQDGISFCNVAEGALNEVHDILGRIKELAVQAASDTYVQEDREAIEAEFTQLKKEINRISRTTEFNTMRIFDDGQFKIEFSDDICPIKIFNASYGDPVDPDTYGGIIVADDVRIAWKTINPDMVTVDPDTGQTMFKAGEYKYETPEYNFTITCEDGSKPPEIKVEFEVSAGSDGITVAGTMIRWEDVINEDGESILDHLGEEGTYHFRNREGEGGFYVEEGAMLGDIIRGLNQYNERVHKRYFNVYNGYYEEKAVDVVDAGTYTKITQSMYENFIKVNKTITDVEFGIRADEDAIWTVDKSGTEMSGSRKTWAELGLEHWDSTNDISDMKTYKYEYTSDDNGTSVEFEFFLLDETSKQSVIEGINNMEIFPAGMKAYNRVSSDFTGTGTYLKNAHVIEDNSSLTVQEEGEFGRWFDSANMALAEAEMSYDAVTNTIIATFKSKNGTTKEMIYESISLPDVEELKRQAEEEVQYQLARAVQRAVSTNAKPLYPSLGEIIGDINNNSSNFKFEDICVTTPDMIKTSGLGTGTFAAKEVDFSSMGITYDLCDLLGLSFQLYNEDVTEWEYAVVQFTYGDATHTTEHGYGYSVTENGIQIDFKTLMEQGISTGEEFTRVLVEIFDEPASGMDSGNVQYAADSTGKLYICDKRPETVGTDRVNNWNYAHQEWFIYETYLDITMKNEDDDRNFTLFYGFDLESEIKNGLSAALVESSDGIYVKDASGTMVVYEESDYYDTDGNLLPGKTAPIRYNIEITENIDWDAIHAAVIQDIIDVTQLEFTAYDYAKLDCLSNENPNEAYVSTFRFETEEEKDEGMWIQAGANRYQGIFMNWEGFSAHYLGLNYLSMTNCDETSTLIRRADKAIEKISGIRSAFGAYTNRLEKMYDMNQTYKENLQYAESRIRDADMAKEIMEHIKWNVLQQASQTLLLQSVHLPERVLELLQ